MGGNFLLHVFLINPVSQYLLTQRNYSRYARIGRAIAFLLFVAVVGVIWEMQDEPENYYQFLGVSKDASLKQMKTAKRRKSLLLHPDKSDSPTADIDFAFLTEVYTVLSDPTKKKYYNKFGPSAISFLTRHGAGNEYDMMTSLGQYYGIWAVLTYILVGSQDGAGGRSWSLCGLFLLGIFEYCMKYTSFDIAEAMFPLTTPYEKVAIIKKLYPAFMHGCRIIAQFTFFNMEEHQRQLINTISVSQTNLMQRISRIEEKLYGKPTPKETSTIDSDEKVKNQLRQRKGKGEGKSQKDSTQSKKDDEKKDDEKKKILDNCAPNPVSHQIFQIPPKKPLIPSGLQGILWMLGIYVFFEVILKQK